MSDVRGFTGIAYRPRSYNSKLDTSKAGYTEQLSNSILYHLQNWTMFNDQICLVRERAKKNIQGYEVKEVETESTGVTKGMLERFNKGTATDDEATKVKTMLSSAVGRGLDHEEISTVRAVGTLLLLEVNIEVINHLLSSDNYINELGDLMKRPELLEQLTPELRNQVLSSKHFTSTLWTLGDHPKVLEQLTPEFRSKILSSKNPADALVNFALHPDLLKLKLAPRVWDEILASEDTYLILSTLGNNPELSLQLTPELWDQILSFTSFQDVALLVLGHQPALAKTLTPELWERVTVLSTLPNGRSRLEFLLKYPRVFEQPKVFDEYMEILGTLYAEKVNEEDVSNHFESLVIPYLLRREEQASSKFGGPFINLSRMLKDPEAARWNTLPIREGDISDKDWENLRTDLEIAMVKHFPGNEHHEKLKNALKWFDKMPQSQDAQAGLQVIRKRVASIVDYLKMQDVKPEILGSEALVDKGIDIAQELVKILADGGTACPDRAAVALEEAERYAKAFSKKEGSPIGYAVNVVVNEFKRNIILAKLVDPKQKESIEMYLYHMLLLNGALGLEYATKSMLHAEYAQAAGLTTPFDEAIKKVYTAFNEEDLVGFVKDHPLIQVQFRGDAKALEEFKKLINDPKEGLGYSGFGVTGPVRFEDINNLEIIDGDTGFDNSEKYIKKLKDLMSKAPSAEALGALRERFFEGDYAAIRDDLYKLNTANAKQLDALASEMEKMIANFKTEKTKFLLKEAGFLTDRVDYEMLDATYWQQEVVFFDDKDLESAIEDLESLC